MNKSWETDLVKLVNENSPDAVVIVTPTKMGKTQQEALHNYARELCPKHSDAWFEGLGAARNGYSLADNGYLENTTEHSDWADGFEALPLYQQGGSNAD